MRKLFFLVLLLSTTRVLNAQIKWDFTTANALAASVPTNITAGAVTQGNNNGTTTFLSAGTPASAVYAGFSAGFNGSLAARIGVLSTVATTGSAYLQAVLTPATGYWLNITGIQCGNFSLSTTGPTTLSIYTSNDNFITSSLLATSTITPSTTAWGLVNLSISPITGLVSTPITIRVYASGGIGTATAGTANWRVDDLSITASAQNTTLSVGAAGSIPKYTSPTTFSNSIITENSGNIGIGTATPATKLDVNGPITTNSGLLMKGGAPIQLWNSLNNNFGVISSFDNGGFKLTTGAAGATGITVLNAGNVGIGTAAPTERLDVNGNVLVPNKTGAFKVGIFSSVSETGGGGALVQGNNIKASSLTDNKLIKSTTSQAGQYINMRYDRGIYFGTGVGVGDNPNTEYPDDINARMVIDLTGNIGVGTLFPVEKLEVNGTLKTNGFKMTTGAGANKILKSDANGLATWGDAPPPVATSAWSLTGNLGTLASTNFIGTTDDQDIVFKRFGAKAGLLSLASGNTAFGVYTLNLNTTGYQNAAFGVRALETNTTGQSNAALGFSALGANTSGFHNVAVGTNALKFNTTGANNTAIGTQALFANTLGYQNIAMGTNSLLNNTEGLSNSAIGFYSLADNTTGSSNTALGSYSSHKNTIGFGNSSFGTQALFKTTSGNSNTAIGSNGLYDNISGNLNTALGYNTGLGITTGSKNTIIGANVIGLPSGLSNNIIIADGDGNRRVNVNEAGNVGIGTTAPTEKLHLFGTNPGILLEGDANSYYPVLRIKSLAGDGWIDNYGPSQYGQGMSMNTKSAQNLAVGIAATRTGSVAHSMDPSVVPFRITATANQTNDIFRVLKNTSTTPGVFSETSALVVTKDGNVLVGTPNNINSAILNIESSNKGALSAPRMTSAQRDLIASPAEGLQIFNTSTHFLNYYNGTAWVQSATGTLGGTAWLLGGNAGTNPNAVTNSDFIGTTDAQRIVFKTNNTEKATVLSTGFVGIGTSAPTEKLHLFGENPVMLLEGDGNSYYPRLQIKSLAGDGWIDNYGPSSSYHGMFLNTKSSQNVTVGIGASTSGSLAIGDPSLVTFRVVAEATQTNDIFKVLKNTAPLGNYTELTALTVNKDGKVLIGDMTGINLNSPTFTHKLAVNGSAIFTKAVVKLTTNWPDFVFEPTYNLPSLNEIEKYINKNKHLPDVPSAEEVKEKGIDLGDNQAILLKKVEELTLYIIDQDKKIIKLQAEKDELKNMQKQIDELKSLLLKKWKV
jgi:hypothetical protein